MDFMRPPELDFTDGGMVDLAGSDNLATDLALPDGDVINAEFTDVSSESPVQLDTLEVRRLMSRLRLDLGHAKDKKRRVDDRAYRDRQAYDLDEKIQEYEGQPNLTMPKTRAKVDAVTGHLLQSINQEPFFAATSHTPEAVEVSPIYEAALERELGLANSKQQLLASPLEAGTVGTAIVGFELAQRPSGEYAVQLKLTRLENFYCYPVAVDDFSKSNTFRRFKQPFWEIRRMADEGLYDPLAVDGLRGSIGGENLTKEEADDNSGGDTLFDENRMVELYECFYRYTPSAESAYSLNREEGGGSVLWQVIFSEMHSEMPLVVRENPYQMAFDAPPYAPLRLAKKSGYVWGTSIPTLLRSSQTIMDESTNNILAYGQLARTPVVEADRNSSLFKTYGENGYKMRPGDLIPRNGPQQAGVSVVQFPPATNAERELAMASESADEVTFNDHMLQGDNYAAGRRTKYEVQSAYGSSATKLKNYLLTFAADMKLVAKMAWAMLDAFKVEPAGIYSVYKDGSTALLSPDGIDAAELQMELQAMLPELMQDPTTRVEASENVLLDAQNGSIVQMGNLKLVKGGIPSTRRDDIEFNLTGTSISADRMVKAQAVQTFAPFFSMLPYAEQDTRVWHILKTMLEGLDIQDYKKWIGEDPMTPNAQAFAMAMAQQSEATANSSVL